MTNRFRDRIRERTLDAIDWVDIRPDPHWTNYALVPLVLGFCLYKLPSGFLPLFLVLCACAAVACLALVLLSIVGTVLYRAVTDVTIAQLAGWRELARSTPGLSVPARQRSE